MGLLGQTYILCMELLSFYYCIFVLSSHLILLDIFHFFAKFYFSTGFKNVHDCLKQYVYKSCFKVLSDHFNVCVTSASLAVDCLLLGSEIFLVLPVLHNFGLCMGCFEYYLMRH